MTYLRARYYDPYQRRFVSEDPAKDGLNWYAYCGNNPVMFVDPSGMEFNFVSEFIDNYGATRLYDNYNEGYTMVELNGFQQKIYWNPVNNTNAYAIYTENIDGYISMERQDFLNLFAIDYDVVRIDYELSRKDARARNTIIAVGTAGMMDAIGFISNSIGYLGENNSSIFIQKGYYAEEWFYVNLNNTTYLTHSQMSKAKEGQRMNNFSNATWSPPGRINRNDWYKEKIILSYSDIKR